MDLAVLNQEMVRMEEEIQFLKKSAEARQHDFQQMNQLLQGRNDENLKKAAQLKRKEERLVRYATNLNSWRSQTKSLCTQLIKEIEAARAMHPLKDYLALTELELTKVEAQLIKTPTGAAERAELELCVGQLIDQRNFLKSTLERSLRQFEKQVQTLVKMFESENLSPLPPPPPPVG